MSSPPRGKPRENKDRDLEKGKAGADKPERFSPEERSKTTTTITSTFEVETPVVKSWKAKLFPSGGRK